MAISPDKSKFFTLESTAPSAVAGYLNDWEKKIHRQVWSFPVADWRADWSKSDLISLQTRPSGNDRGYLYFLNLSNGRFSKILSDITGLTTLTSPDGQRVVFSNSSLGGVDLYSYDLATQKSFSLGLKTLAEKCSWIDATNAYCAVPRQLPNGLYPDDWYQGKVTFADDIWRLDLKQRTVSLVLRVNGSYDLTSLVISTKRGWLYAINRKDGTIQAFALSNN